MFGKKTELSSGYALLDRMHSDVGRLRTRVAEDLAKSG